MLLICLCVFFLVFMRPWISFIKKDPQTYIQTHILLFWQGFHFYSRTGRRPLDANNLIYWFKNTRAALKRSKVWNFKFISIFFMKNYTKTLLILVLHNFAAHGHVCMSYDILLKLYMIVGCDRIISTLLQYSVIQYFSDYPISGQIYTFLFTLRRVAKVKTF